MLMLLLAFVAFNRRIRQANARIYHGHDFTGLFQLATAGIWRRPIVYDSHELFFDRPFADLPLPLRLIIYAMRPLEKILARRAVGFITVSNAIADRLAQTLSIPRPIVLYNAVDIRRWGSPATLYPVNGRKIVAHTGNIVDTRHLPELVEAISRLPDVALVLMGDGPLRDQLTSQAQMLGMSERLVIVPPVLPEAVAPTLAQADIGAVLTTSTITNHNMTIGNKFFEAIAAGLPLVTGPNVEVAQLMKQYDLGIVCNPSDPASILDAIQTLLHPDKQAHYRASAQRAREVLTWEHQERELLALYERLLGKPR
jgi:glycosyltransferase involved in cell wall biosynthesis